MPPDRVEFGDIFHYQGDWQVHPITGAILPFERRYIVDKVVSGRIHFWPPRPGGQMSVACDDMEGAYCPIDSMKYFKLAWELENPA